MGQDCCPSADGKTATCGACCSATGCDDKIGCTKDQCGGGQCSHTPKAADEAGACAAGYLCDPAQNGCVKAPDCKSASDCKPTACQSNASCVGGTCHFDTCTTQGLKCCDGGATGSAGCAICCGNDCADTVDCTTDTCTANGCMHTPNNGACAQGLICDLKHGCVSCQKDTDCDVGLSCTSDACDNDPTMGTFTCSHKSMCKAPQFCTANGCSSCVSDSRLPGRRDHDQHRPAADRRRQLHDSQVREGRLPRPDHHLRGRTTLLPAARLCDSLWCSNELSARMPGAARYVEDAKSLPDLKLQAPENFSSF